MKELFWLGASRKALQTFSPDARRNAGYQLHRVQTGSESSDWKPMPQVGAGVREIRIFSEKSYRVLYVAKFKEAVYVLHAFEKKTQKTSVADIELAATRYKLLITKEDGS